MALVNVGDLISLSQQLDWVLERLRKADEVVTSISEKC